MVDSTKGVDVATVRDAIARDLALVGGYAAELGAALQQANARAILNSTRLASGESVGSQASLGAADLDMLASKLARRIDHMQALVEVAYLAEQGDL